MFAAVAAGTAAAATAPPAPVCVASELWRPEDCDEQPAITSATPAAVTSPATDRLIAVPSERPTVAQDPAADPHACQQI